MGTAEGVSDAALRSAVQALVDAGASGAIVRVDDGHRVRQVAVGRARLDPAVPIRADDQVRVGSITKTFMSTIVLQLIAQHRLGLEDTVQRWLPGQVPNGEHITLRMLLNHTSGIYNYTDDEAFLAAVVNDPQREWSPSELVAKATAHPPLFAPGTGISYSNTNYLLVGLILQRATGRPIEELVRERIIEPLRLSRTFFATSARFTHRYAHGYLTPGLIGPDYVDSSGWSPSWAWTAGAMVSTAPDLARFYRALLSGRLMPAAELQQMLTTTVISPGTGYGLGIFTTQTSCGKVWGHNGSIPGYASYSVTDPAGARSAVILVPTTPNQAISDKMSATVDTATCAMFGRPVPATAAASPTLPTGALHAAFPALR